MRILLDMDGIVCNLLMELLRRYNQAVDAAKTIDDVTCWDLEKCLPGANITKVFSEPGFFLSLPPISPAISTIEKIKKDFKHHITVVTRHSSASGAAEKIEWCRNQMGIGHRDIVCAHDKFLVKGDILIDDSGENLVSYKAHWPDAYTIGVRYPYNRPEDADFMVESHKDHEGAWDQIYQIVKALTIAESRHVSGREKI